jgi:hypothetical protein
MKNSNNQLGRRFEKKKKKKYYEAIGIFAGAQK